LRGLPATDFGLIVQARPVDPVLLRATAEDPSTTIPIRTSALMGRWGRISDARAFIDLAITKDLGDTSAADIPQ
jgi:hypothetical protein